MLEAVGVTLGQLTGVVNCGGSSPSGANVFLGVCGRENPWVLGPNGGKDSCRVFRLAPSLMSELIGWVIGAASRT